MPMLILKKHYKNYVDKMTWLTITNLIICDDFFYYHSIGILVFEGMGIQIYLVTEYTIYFFASQSLLIRQFVFLPKK